MIDISCLSGKIKGLFPDVYFLPIIIPNKFARAIFVTIKIMNHHHRYNNDLSIMPGLNQQLAIVAIGY